jgi:hypothetical protein
MLHLPHLASCTLVHQTWTWSTLAADRLYANPFLHTPSPYSNLACFLGCVCSMHIMLWTFISRLPSHLHRTYILLFNPLVSCMMQQVFHSCYIRLIVPVFLWILFVERGVWSSKVLMMCINGLDSAILLFMLKSWDVLRILNSCLREVFTLPPQSRSDTRTVIGLHSDFPQTNFGWVSCQIGKFSPSLS